MMDESLVANWNAVVRTDDLVWHLGDFGYRLKAERIRELLAALNGRKRLIVGNNDDPTTVAVEGWEGIDDYVESELDGTRLVLCHYPFKSWNRMRKGARNFHGHSHGAPATTARQADVGVDVWGFRPIALSEILSRRNGRVITRADDMAHAEKHLGKAPRSRNECRRQHSRRACGVLAMRM